MALWNTTNRVGLGSESSLFVPRWDGILERRPVSKRGGYMPEALGTVRIRTLWRATDTEFREHWHLYVYHNINNLFLFSQWILCVLSLSHHNHTPFCLTLMKLLIIIPARLTSAAQKITHL
jgi:hypothetical protein